MQLKLCWMYVLPKQTATRYKDYACKQGGEIDDCRRHLITTAIVCFDKLKGVMNGPLKFLTARKTLPLLDLLAKFKRVLACSCSPNFCVARKLAKHFFYCCSCSQKNRSARHARECSQRPFVTPWGRNPRGYSTKFYTGRLCPSSNPVPFYYHFWHKKVPV